MGHAFRRRRRTGRFTPAILNPTLWLEPSGNGSLVGDTGAYTGPLHSQTEILAALTGTEICSAWNSVYPATKNVTRDDEFEAPGWLTRAENTFAIAPALDFAATGHGLIATPIDLSVGCSIAVVFETDSVALGGQVLINSTSGAADRFTMGINSTDLRAGWFDTAFRGAKSGTVAAATRYVVQYYRDGATGALFINGVSQSGTNQPSNLTSTTARLSVGSRSDLSANSFDGRIMAVLAKGGADGWGTTAQAALDNYLKKTFNVAF